MSYIFKEVAGGESYSGLYYTEDKILDLINILEPSYLAKLNELKLNPNDTSDILDKIGELLGVKRTINLLVEGSQREITLGDDDYLMYIKSQIIKDNYNGTREQILQYYTDIGLNNIVLKTYSAGIVTTYLPIDTTISDNIKYLFLNGKLQVESLGISYQFAQLISDVVKWIGYNSSTGTYEPGAYKWWDGTTTPAPSTAGKWGL